MMNCTEVNGTLQVYFAPLSIRNTQFENATAARVDEIFRDGFYNRIFHNGTIVRYQPTGVI